MFSKIVPAAIGALAVSSLLASAAPTQLHKRDVSIVNSCVNKNQVALSWDDGPYIYEQDIAGHLQNSGSKGTFFFNGNSGYRFYLDERRETD
jgi:peptidoglycan/xylan/chitin deacetylase (PgdA/CDA1 family)